jgi:hypothetical protein
LQTVDILRRDGHPADTLDLIVWVLLPLLFALVQIPSRTAESTKSPEALALVEKARALPSELRADALLRLVESSLVTQPAWKQELIEEAFWSGSHALLPYLQRADGRSESIVVSAIKPNGLEALTLQSKAVQAMLLLSSEKALRLFNQMPPLSLPSLDCSAAATPDLTAYYQTGALLFQRSFTATQRTNGDDVTLLRQLVDSIQAPTQVAPALEMLNAVKLDQEQRRELTSHFAARLYEISRSDREYGGTEGRLVSAISADQIRSSDVPVLLPALRSYVVRHISGRRCVDNIAAAGKIARTAEAFNALVDRVDPRQSSFKHISPEESKPAGIDGTYLKDVTGQSENSQAITEALRWLDHDESAPGTRVVHWTAEQRSSADWLEHYDEAVKLVHDLKERDEISAEAFFCVKADALNALAMLAPPGLTRDKAMEEYRELLEDYYPSIENRNLWFTMFRHMLYTARFSDDLKTKAWILDNLTRSTNPVIALYAQLEKRIGPPHESYPPSYVKAERH